MADEATASVTVTTEAEEEALPPAGGGGMPVEWFNPPKPPIEGFRILINNGAEYTDSRMVTLNLAGGPDTERMIISNFPDFRDAGQESYTSTKKWDICRGLTSCHEGKYNVYVKFYTSWGTASKVVFNGIIYRKKPIEVLIIERIQTKINEISRKIVDLRKQITQLFKKEVVAKVPEITPPKIPPDEIVPPVEEIPPKEEIITPPKEVLSEKERKSLLDSLKEYTRWFGQKIITLWQRILPF